MNRRELFAGLFGVPFARRAVPTAPGEAESVWWRTVPTKDCRTGGTLEHPATTLRDGRVIPPCPYQTAQLYENQHGTLRWFPMTYGFQHREQA